MMDFLKYLDGQEFRRVQDGGVVMLDDSSAAQLNVAINPEALSVRVTARDCAARLVVVRDCEAKSGAVNISIEDGAKLNLVDVMCSFSKTDVTILQSANSVLNSTLLQLSAADAAYTIDLAGKGADTEVNILQLPTANDTTKCNLRISHMSPNCASRSTSKCVASGESTGEFHGLVYVAQDAQQTLSEQSSRNISLSREAKIVAEPQLEIYADDVKCTHGATVGQMDKDAILYMRQRGLSEDQARKVQLDGFVSDVVRSCAVVDLHEPLMTIVHKRLNDL